MSNSEELYEWINKRYEQAVNGEITEEEYLKDLDEYKKKLGMQEESSSSEKKSVSTSKVRSTSIAGLRSKLLDELNKE